MHVIRKEGFSRGRPLNEKKVLETPFSINKSSLCNVQFVIFYKQLHKHMS